MRISQKLEQSVCCPFISPLSPVDYLKPAALIEQLLHW
jgi:hypothetical protein